MSFAFSETELLSGEITHARLMRLLHESSTSVLSIKETTNSYGEFLFVTVAGDTPCVTPAESPLPEQVNHFVITFWGLGFHDARECWLTDLWRWHVAQFTDANMPAIDKVACLNQIEARLQICRAEAAHTSSPSSRAQAFTFFAELGDEDGALTELEDLEALGVDVEALFDD
jgi:hypothetical protein